MQCNDICIGQNSGAMNESNSLFEAVFSAAPDFGRNMTKIFVHCSLKKSVSRLIKHSLLIVLLVPLKLK